MPYIAIEIFDFKVMYEINPIYQGITVNYTRTVRPFFRQKPVYLNFENNEFLFFRTIGL